MRNLKKRGVALVWATIMSFILLVVGGSMATIVIKESQMTMDIAESTRAYANAKTGVDWGTKYIQDGGTSPFEDCFDFTGGQDCGSSENKANIKITGSVVESVGYFGGARRKIKETVTPISNGVKITSANSSPYVPGSFKLQFDFWKTTSEKSLVMGLNDGSTPSNRIVLVENTTSGNYQLVYKNPGTAASGTTINLLKPDNSVLTLGTGSPYQYRAVINYVNKTYITVSVFQSVSGVYSCIGSAQATANMDFGSFKNLEVATGATYTTTGAAEDREYWKNAGADNHYYDNVYLKGSTANPLPTGTFTATASGTLTWTSSNATLATITPTVGRVTPVRGGSTTVAANSGLYTLTLSGPGGTKSYTAPTSPPSCTLTPRRTGLTTYYMDWVARDASSVSESGGNPAVPNDYNGGFSGYPAGYYSGSKLISPHIDNPQSTYTMTVTNSAGSGTCSHTFALWSAYGSNGSPVIQTFDGASWTNPTYMNTVLENRPDNNLYATLTLPKNTTTDSAKNARTYVDFYLYNNGLVNFEPKLRIFAKSTKAVKYTAYIDDGTLLWPLAANTTTTTAVENTTECTGCLSGLKYIAIDPVALAKFPGGYNKVGVHFYGDMVSAQTIYFDGLYVYNW